MISDDPHDVMLVLGLKSTALIHTVGENSHANSSIFSSVARIHTPVVYVTNFRLTGCSDTDTRTCMYPHALFALPMEFTLFLKQVVD